MIAARDTVTQKAIAEGRAALPRLWRYGHECWVIRDGVEIRIDDADTPPDTTPLWARQQNEAIALTK